MGNNRSSKIQSGIKSAGLKKTPIHPLDIDTCVNGLDGLSRGLNAFDLQRITKTLSRLWRFRDFGDLTYAWISNAQLNPWRPSLAR